jgi:pilus assembly protein Flp/PilA
MKSLAVGIKRFLRDEEGVTMVEYGLIAALIAIVCIVFITNVGMNLNAVFGEICNRLNDALGTAGVNGVSC